jgi:hypothetical protein
MTAALTACGSTSPTSSSPGGDWTPPVNVARVAGRASSLGIAAGGSTVLLTWDAAPEEPLRVARLAADGHWRIAAGPPAISASSRQAGVDALGRAVLAWSALLPEDLRFRCAWAATAAPSREWAPSRRFGCGVNEVGLAVGPSGHALVTWSWSNTNGLAAAPYDPAAGWQDGYAFTAGDRVPPSFDAAVDEGGTYAIAWHERPDPSDGGSITLALARGRALTILPVTDVLPAQRDPRVAFESPGVAVLAWSGGIGRGVRAGRLAANGGVTTSITEDPDDTCHEVAGSGRGASVIVWSRQNGAPGLLRARGVYAAPGAEGRWEPRAIASDHGLLPMCPQVAMDAEGNAAVAWEERFSNGTAPQIWATTRPARTGEWAAPLRLAVGGTQPEVAIASGVAYVVWVTESGDLIQESRLRLAP